MRFVIMSLGSIGRRHLMNLRATYPKADIAIWRRHDATDEVPPAADHLFRSFAEVLGYAPDAAIIASPASEHLRAALALASSGVHLLVEKPLSVSSEGARELIRLCCDRQVVLMVGYNLRFMPSLARLRELVQTGAIGTVLSARAEVGQYLPDWRSGADYRRGVTAQSVLGGGVLLELSHEIDYVLWTLGLPEKLTAVGGKFSNLECDVEDLVEILLEYDQPRSLVSVHLDMLQRSATRSFRIVGTDGVLTWDGIADRVDLFRAISNQWQRVDVEPLADRNQMYVDQLRAFVGSIENRTQPEFGGEAALQVLKVVDAAREAMQSRRSIDLHWSQCA